MMEKRNNYAIQVEQAKKLFLTYDQGQIIDKLKLAHDDTYLYIPFLDFTYRIHRVTANVEKRAGEGTYQDGNSFNEVLTIFDVLCFSKAGGHPAGQWVSLSSLGGGVHGGGTINGFFNDKIKKISAYEGRLAAALERMGGIRMPQGEPGYCVQAFPFLPIYFQYWRADDEFPAQIRLLWDANTTQFIHYETVYYLGDYFLERLLQIMETT